MSRVLHLCKFFIGTGRKGVLAVSPGEAAEAIRQWDADYGRDEDMQLRFDVAYWKNEEENAHLWVEDHQFLGLSVEEVEELLRDNPNG